MWPRRSVLGFLGGAPAVLAGCVSGSDERRSAARWVAAQSFSCRGETLFGPWRVDGVVSSIDWRAGDSVEIEVLLEMPASLLANFRDAIGFAPESLLLLVTNERAFDAQGIQRFPLAFQASTLMTPSGLAIEGGDDHAISQICESPHVSPIEERIERLLRGTAKASPGGDLRVDFRFRITVPDDLPPGIERLRFDFGFASGTQRRSLSGDGFGRRPNDRDKVKTTAFGPPVRVNGLDAAGRPVEAAAIRPRLHWSLLHRYPSNGTYGVVADEDAGVFALASRNIIQDQVVLPISGYNVEPEFIFDGIDLYRAWPWKLPSGELAIQVTGPDGVTIDLGTAPFAVCQRPGRPTTKRPQFANWRPKQYGPHAIRATGWIEDVWGNRYEGGGTYRFWIAERMTMATATFQGMPYPVGGFYGRPIGFAPAVTADVTVDVRFYPRSDPARVKTFSYSGRATEGGIFGPGQGMKRFVFEEPGEYFARVFATYTDRRKRLWVCSLSHAGVVYPKDTPLVAHGKKLKVAKTFVERGHSGFEGYTNADGTKVLDHPSFPYHAGDVLLIASEGLGANKIEHGLTYDRRDRPQTYDEKIFQRFGRTNVRIRARGDFSPHLYPELIEDWAYYYAAGPRPGFSSRFSVGEDGYRFGYWQTSDTRFGNQFGASDGGDSPGDIYRLLGGVILREKGAGPLYAGYLASAFILPGGSNDNRVIRAGEEDLLGPDGSRRRFFLVTLRPGMIYAQGSPYVPVAQIDPILPAKVWTSLIAPDGRRWETNGIGDEEGGFAGRETWTLDQPGVWRYEVRSEWNGHPGRVPGLPDEGGFIFVTESPRAPQPKPLRILIDGSAKVDPVKGLVIEGESTSDKVAFAAVIPGAVIGQGWLPVERGRFRYVFDPVDIHRRVPAYDIFHDKHNKPELWRIAHLTFFAKEKAPDGSTYWAASRVIIRGEQAVWAEPVA